MNREADMDTNIRILKQHIDQAAGSLEKQRQEGSQDEGLGALIYLGSHQDSIPRNLLLDPLLKSGEVHTWALLKIQMINPAVSASIPRQEDLMTILKCSRPVLSRHMQVLRAMRWITLCEEVRGRDGQYKGHVYAQHDKPLSLQETLFLDPGYLRFLEQPTSGLALKRLRQVKQSILMYTDFQMLKGIDLNRQPTHLEQSLGRLKSPILNRPDINTALACPAGLHGYDDEGSLTVLEHPPVDNSPLERLEEKKHDDFNHVNNFYTAKEAEIKQDQHVKKFYMDTRSSSSSYITTTTKKERLSFPKAIKTDREQIYALKLLSVLEEERQQFALDYLSDRIKAGEQSTDKPVGNTIRYLDWIVKQIKADTLPESTYGIRQAPNRQKAESQVDEAAQRQQEHDAWIKSMRDRGYEMDPITGLPKKSAAKSGAERSDGVAKRHGRRTAGA